MKPQEISNQKGPIPKQSSSKKSSQRTTIKKSSKTGNNLTENQSSFKKSKNINMENPPNDTQIKYYENMAKEGMNRRVDIFKTKEKVSKLEKDLETKTKKLEKETKKKENFQNYLSKLEQIVKEKTDTDNQQTKNIQSVPSSKNKEIEVSDNKQTENKNEESQNVTEQTEENENNKIKLTICVTGATPTISMDDGQGNKNIIKSKKGLMKFLYKIYSENQNLNNFQRQVFDLSKDYDDINNIMEEGISGFKEIAKGTKNENIQNLVDEKLKELKTEIETSLEQKQKEYNEQLNKKEEEINMLTKAYDNIYKEVQQKNSDKIHEQMTIKNLNSQIEILETKLAFLKENH